MNLSKLSERGKILSACFAFWLVAAAIVLTGCKSTGAGPSAVSAGTNGVISVYGHQLDPQTIGRDLKIAAREGTRAGIRYDSNSREYLVAAVAVLDAALNDGTFDPALIQQSLSSISVSELQDPHVIDGVTDVFELYSNHFGEVVAGKLDQNIYARPMLTGLRDGIVSGLQ